MLKSDVAPKTGTDFVGARVEHERLALFFGVRPSAGGDTGLQRQTRPQSGQHDGWSAGRKSLDEKTDMNVISGHQGKTITLL